MKIRSAYLSTSLFALIALTLFLLPFTACQRSGSNGKQLTLAVNSGVEGDALKQAARDYETQTGVHINIAEFPYANLFEKELIDLNARTGAYDLIMLDDPWFPKFASVEALTDLTPLYEKRALKGPDEDFVSTSIALCRHPYQTGALYALPYVGNSQLFFYRKDIFEKHSLKEPATWDDVLASAKTISESETTGAPDGSRLNGYVMRAAQGNAVVADFMPIFWAFGAEMFDAGGKPTVNSPEGINALKFMLELGRYAPPGYASFNADEVSAHLLQGTAAMSINWPAWISPFSDPARSKVIGKMEFTTMPGAAQPGRAEIGNWLIAIPRDAKNAPAAFDFLVWATSREQMKRSALRGNPPTRKSVFTDPELLAKFPAYPAQLRSLESSRPRPRTPLWNEIENAFGIFLSKANSGELSPEDAMNQANAKISEIIERGK
ncbi:MAG: multiple sugar transport system substrate-binding protein [Acidobacteriota bacterium]|jgi:multiple sugar transport system substrate-binding protein|nr:multiple sugar transport system substrate-binding protein [Acidobacteriota bacterium]